MPDRKLAQDIFIRVCRDAQFRLPTHRAAALAAMMLSTHPLAIWLAMPSYSVMEEIACGVHPATRNHP